MPDRYSARMFWARSTVRVWNEKHEGQFACWEWVEEALIAFFRWQHTRSSEALLKHDEYARRLPADLRRSLGAIAWREMT